MLAHNTGDPNILNKYIHFTDLSKDNGNAKYLLFGIAIISIGKYDGCGDS